jgi:type IV pilus assembly protein PilX
MITVIQPSTESMQRRRGGQRGASLVMVLIVMTVVSLMGVAGIQIAAMSERGARNDRDQQVAWQSAEAALMDAEFDIFGPSVTSTRRSLFGAHPDLTVFATGCGTDSSSTGNAGLCAIVTSGKPAWMSVDFTATGSSAPTTAFGTFTSRTFQAGGAGVQPARVPRYVVEAIRDPNDRDLSSTDPKFIYRVTAMGFGPRVDIQAVLQMYYRI